MARHAVWLSRPDDPRTALGWYLADERRCRVHPALALALTASSIAIAWVWSPWAWFLVPLLALQIRLGSRPPCLERLATLPPPGPAFHVHMEVIESKSIGGRGWLLGRDAGIVTFVDGWLHFAGLRTEFSVRPADAADVSHWQGTARVLLRHAEAVSLTPYDPEETDVLGRALKVWLLRPSSPTGEPILPPSSIHRSGVLRAWADVLTITSVTATVLLAFVHLMGAGIYILFGLPSLDVFRRLAWAHRLVREDRRALANETRTLEGR